MTDPTTTIAAGPGTTSGPMQAGTGCVRRCGRPCVAGSGFCRMCLTELRGLSAAARWLERFDRQLSEALEGTR